MQRIGEISLVDPLTLKRFIAPKLAACGHTLGEVTLKFYTLDGLVTECPLCSRSLLPVIPDELLEALLKSVAEYEGVHHDGSPVVERVEVVPTLPDGEAPKASDDRTDVPHKLLPLEKFDLSWRPLSVHCEPVLVHVATVAPLSNTEQTTPGAAAPAGSAPPKDEASSRPPPRVRVHVIRPVADLGTTTSAPPAPAAERPPSSADRTPRGSRSTSTDSASDDGAEGPSGAPPSLTGEATPPRDSTTPQGGSRPPSLTVPGTSRGIQRETPKGEGFVPPWSGDPAQVLKAGWLQKRGANWKISWSRKWVEFAPGLLRYGGSHRRMTKTLNTKSIQKVILCFHDGEVGSREHCIALHTRDRIHYFAAVDEATKFDWLDALQRGLGSDIVRPFRQVAKSATPTPEDLGEWENIQVAGGKLNFVNAR